MTSRRVPSRISSCFALCVSRALPWVFQCSAMGFLVPRLIRSPVRYPTCSRRVPYYVPHTFAAGSPMSFLICYTVSFPLAFHHLFPYACFACIRLASLLFPVGFAIRCSVHSSIRNPHAFPRSFLVGSLLHGSPHAFSRPLHRAFPVRTPLSVPHAFPVYSADVSLRFGFMFPYVFQRVPQ